MAKVENPYSPGEVRKGTLREVVFKLRPPIHQQGKMQDEVIQAERLERTEAWREVELP